MAGQMPYLWPFNSPRSPGLEPCVFSFTKPPGFFTCSTGSDLKAAFLGYRKVAHQRCFLATLILYCHLTPKTHYGKHRMWIPLVCWQQPAMCQKITQADPSDREHMVVANGAFMEVPSTPQALRHGWSVILISTWGVYRIKSILCECWDLRRCTKCPSAVFLVINCAVCSRLGHAEVMLSPSGGDFSRREQQSPTYFLTTFSRVYAEFPDTSCCAMWHPQTLLGFQKPRAVPSWLRAGEEIGKGSSLYWAPLSPSPSQLPPAEHVLPPFPLSDTPAPECEADTWAGFRSVRPVQSERPWAQKDPTLGLMLCCCIFKFSVTFE